ncbi:NAD-dependent epimerase/dehydratase family protein [Haliangium ochraceum]|uniref:NAD-dependent epimerase/dehydratase n=1 Tax=Haliangium ochraceum (strain DSM 14365 / JCM 11303 / SMP-2) TaxID=502025 RepID=D0LK88_HALO1|nr:NAD(P)-dependent oxidoreductase [Haliangium ochraceum]ACY13122.1 NAD-dependent epimerase/dehydratase [Haliangium ochraceum DSM 14365]
MKILVTGANGFLGSALVRRLCARGLKGIRCLVRPGSDRSRLDAIEKEYPGSIELCIGTLNRPSDCVRALEGVDLVQHLAAATGGAPADMFQNSVVATKNLLEAMLAEKREIRLVFCSSFAVYGVADLPRGTVVDEETPIEANPTQRDMYSHTKLRQEQLVWRYHREHRIPTAFVRPGVIYGPGGGSAISARVGLNLFGIFLHLGRNNVLPLTFVDNCAEALAVVGEHPESNGQAYNVVDDDLLGAKEYLSRYRAHVAKLRYLTLPFFATRLLSLAVERYYDHSGGQLPAIFTRYKTDSQWKGNRFSNAKLKALGWEPLVSTDEGLERHFAYRRELAA